MTRRHKRLLFMATLFVAIGCVFSIISLELRKNISFFCTPSELLSDPERRSSPSIRVGGMVVEGSVIRSADSITFEITDFKTNLQIVYKGILPPLFQEGVDSIAKGRLEGEIFIAEEILAKHDEKYMPKKPSYDSH